MFVGGHYTYTVRFLTAHEEILFQANTGIFRCICNQAIHFTGIPQVYFDRLHGHVHQHALT